MTNEEGASFVDIVLMCLSKYCLSMNSRFTEQGGSQESAEALQKLLSTAIQKNVVIPLGIVSSVMQKAKELGNNGQKMDALLGTTIAAVRNVDDPYPMALR